MKSHRSIATIAIYFLFTLLWMALFVHASENEEIQIPHLENAITQTLQQDDHGDNNEKRANVFEQKWKMLARLQHKLSQDRLMKSLFQSCKTQILSTIFNKFLTIRDILTLRKTCTDFQLLLFPNDEYMVMFRNDFGSKNMNNVSLMWFDLKYFLDHSYTTALEKLAILNLKQNQYTFFTRNEETNKWCNEAMNVWYNEEAIHHYPKLILNKITNENSQPPVNYIPLKIYAKSGANAWAKITQEGKIMIGGKGSGGDDSKDIQSQLKDVKMIVSTKYAFSALLGDRSVVSWGDEGYGGVIPEPIQTQLKNVKTIISTSSAFAALLWDGNVITWGYEKHGGKIPDELILKNVKSIISTNCAFAALLDGGRVVVWGDYGEISDDIQNQLQKDVKMIFSNGNAFAALLANGGVVAWGKETMPGAKIHHSIQDKLINVKMIFSTENMFAALLHDGSMFVWRNLNEYWPRADKNKKMIFSNDRAFVLLLNDGSFEALGDECCGGRMTHEIQTKLKNVKVIFSSSRAFAAILEDGSVFTWGDPNFGGRIPEKFESKLQTDVRMIIPQKNGFTALCNDGTMITWGSNYI